MTSLKVLIVSLIILCAKTKHTNSNFTESGITTETVSSGVHDFDVDFPVQNIPRHQKISKNLQSQQPVNIYYKYGIQSGTIGPIFTEAPRKNPDNKKKFVFTEKLLQGPNRNKDKKYDVALIQNLLSKIYVTESESSDESTNSMESSDSGSETTDSESSEESSECDSSEECTSSDSESSADSEESGSETSAESSSTDDNTSDSDDTSESDSEAGSEEYYTEYTINSSSGEQSDSESNYNNQNENIFYENSARRSRNVEMFASISEDKVFEETMRKLFGTDYNDIEPRIPEEKGELFENINHGIEKHIWHSQISSENSVEDLRIEELTVNKQFQMEHPVTEWVSFNNKAVGRYKNRLTLVTVEDDGQIKIDSEDLEEEISSLCIFEWWNHEIETLQTILITAQDARIDWYYFSGDNTLEQLWSWDVSDPITHIQVLKYKNHWKLLVVYDSSNSEQYSNGEYTTLYGLNLWQDWWVIQKLHGSGRPAASEYGQYIATPAPESVTVYQHSPQLDKYEIIDNIKSSNVGHLCWFTSDAELFLAISGDSSAIYEVTSQEVVPAHISNYYLDHVEQWLPINLDIYRNEVILLLQHRLDHQSHTSSVIESLKWTGSVFELIEHVPCHIHTEEMHGFSCLTEAEGDNGIRGAVQLNYGENKNNILLASENMVPVLFEIKTKVYDVIDPVLKEMIDTIETFKEIKTHFHAQRNELKILEKELVKSHNMVTGKKWTINKLYVPSLNLQSNLESFKITDSKLRLDEKVWPDDPISLSHKLRNNIEHNNIKAKSLFNQIKRAVKKNETIELLNKPILLSKGVTAQGILKVKNADIESLNNVQINHTLSKALHRSSDHKLHLQHKKISGQLNVTHLFVTGKINGLNTEDFRQIPIKLSSDITFDQPLTIANNLIINGVMNNIDVKKDILILSEANKIDALKFDNVRVKNGIQLSDTMNGFNMSSKSLSKSFEHNDNFNGEVIEESKLNIKSLEVFGSFDLDNINGMNWKNFEEDIVFKNMQNNLNVFNVNGKTVSTRELELENLNGLRYPDDYVLKSEPKPLRFTGHKIFSNGVTSGVVECVQINEINPSDFISLKEKQQVKNLTFYDLTISKKLNIKGKIIGNEVNKILPNPLLSDSKSLHSNFIFSELRVSGEIFIHDQFNNTEIKSLKNELVLNNGGPITIDRPKRFLSDVSVNGNLNIRSNKINKIMIDDIFSAENQQFEQDLTIDKALLKRLDIGGSFGNTNLTDLLVNAVQTDKTQIIEGKITFEADTENQNYFELRDESDFITMNNLMVTEYCNSWKVPESLIILKPEQPNIISDSLKFKHIRAETLIIDGNLVTGGKVAGLDIKQFERERLSLSKDQVINGAYQFENCSVPHLNAKNINSQTVDVLSFVNNKIENIKNEILSGNLVLDMLHIKNNFSSSTINQIYCKQLSENTIWLDRENYINSNLTFLNPIVTNKIQIDELFENINYPEFVNNVVYTDESPMHLSGRMIYENHIQIKYLETKRLNNMMAEHILYKNQIGDINKNVILRGEVNISNANLYGQLKNIMTANKTGEYYINKNVYMDGNQIIDNIYVNGYVNEKHLIKDIFQSLVWMGKDTTITSKLILLQPLIATNIIANYYNGISLQSLINDIVYKYEENNIRGKISFIKPLKINGILVIRKILESEFINGYNVTEWFEEAIFLDKEQTLMANHVFGSVVIKGNLQTKYINNIDLGNVITLTTPQVVHDIIIGTLQLNENVLIKNKLNEANLNVLHKNSLMKYGEQVIKAPLTFYSKLGLKSCSVLYLNNIPTSNFLTAHTKQTVHGTYNFVGNTTVNNLQLSGHINEISINDWLNDAVYTNAFGNSILLGKWSISGKLNLFGSVKLRYINNQDVSSLFKYVNRAENAMKQFNSYSFSRYHKLHNELEFLGGKLYEYFNSFGYFIEIQSIPLYGPSQIHTYTTINDKYLIIQKLGSCESDVWHWNSIASKFFEIAQILTGVVKQWRKINFNGELYLACQSYGDTCPVKGINYFNIMKNSAERVILSTERKLTSLTLDDNNQTNISKESELEIEGENRDKIETKSLSIIGSSKNAQVYQFEMSVHEYWLAYAYEDRIEIHSNDARRKPVQVIETVKPTSIRSILMSKFDILLLFLENYEKIHVYSFKGVGGFVHTKTVNASAKNIHILKLQESSGVHENYLFIENEDSIRIYKTEMTNKKVAYC